MQAQPVQGPFHDTWIAENIDSILTSISEAGALGLGGLGEEATTCILGYELLQRSRRVNPNNPPVVAKSDVGRTDVHLSWLRLT
jgi:hypothetical protein